MARGRIVLRADFVGGTAVRLTRPRTLYLLFLLALGFLSLRPYPPAEAILDGLLLPTRALGELTTPASWLTRNAVRAGAGNAHTVAAEIARRDALLEAVLRTAEPDRRGLLAGRGWVHGEVFERSGRNLDRIIIALPVAARIERGMPVVSGEAFVGWTKDPIRDRPGHWEVTLVTAGTSRVGAWLETPGREDPTAFFVAGGLAPIGRSDVVLGIHNPSRCDLPRGTVEVYEPEVPGEAPWSRLANGFRLGTLLREQRGAREVLGILPELDYRSGLYEVLVLCPPDWNAPEVVGQRDPMQDGGWVSSRFLLDGDPSPRRYGRRLSSGRWAGLEPGAAVVEATRLVGRVAHVGWADASVALPSDPGFSFPALAHPIEGGRPRALGRLVSRGPVPGGLLFHWEAALPLPAGTSLATHIHTGSGDRGLPRGLWVGDCVLPGGAGPHDIVIREAAPTPPAGAPLWVRRSEVKAP